MRKLPLLFGLTLLISCVGAKVQDQNTSSEATTEGIQTTSESSANEDTVADTWGQIVEAPPETFFAAGLSDDVRNGLTNTLLIASAEWGNYGPLEYWDVSRGPWKKNGALHSVIRVSDQAATSACSRTSLRRW